MESWARVGSSAGYDDQRRASIRFALRLQSRESQAEIEPPALTYLVVLRAQRHSGQSPPESCSA